MELVRFSNYFSENSLWLTDWSMAEDVRKLAEVFQASIVHSIDLQRKPEISEYLVYDSNASKIQFN